MTDLDDQQFAAVAADRQFAKPDSIDYCRQMLEHERAEGAPRRSLAELMVAEGRLTAEQVEIIRTEMERRARERFLGTYELRERIGEGGMGAVYRARCTKTGIDVAVKVMDKERAEDEEFRKRFLRESKLGMKLDHPNVAQTIDFGVDRDVHYLVMEMIPGGDLEKRRELLKVLPEEDALEIVKAVAMGLQHAHANGIVHRDIKPANIMFQTDGSVKLTDFGLVKQHNSASTQLTQSGMAVGTPHYMSPEQAKGEKNIDGRTDIYSLGATLYYLVTGRTPFDGSSPYELLAKVLNTELTPPDELNPKLSDGCVAVIEKMMAKNRGNRYLSADELLEDINHVLAGRRPENAHLDPGLSTVAMSARRVKLIQAGSLERTQVGATGPTQTNRPRVNRTQATPRRRPPVDRKPVTPWVITGVAAALAVAFAWMLFSNGDTRSNSASRKQGEPSGKKEVATKSNDSDGRKTPERSPAGKGSEHAGDKKARPRPDPKRTPRKSEDVQEPAEQPTPPPPDPWQNAVNLLPRIDPNQDGVVGAWRREGADVISPSAEFARLQIPYRAPDEYDFRIEFTVQAGRGEVFQMLTKSGKFAQWSMWGMNYTTHAFVWDDQVFSPDTETNPTAVSAGEEVQRGRRYVSRVEVRNEGITAFLDDVQIARWAPRSFSAVPNNRSIRLRDTSLLGLGAWNSSVRFHSVQVREVTGRGTFTRAP